MQVVFQREHGWWFASAPAVQGCDAKGRSIAEARRRLRAALAVDHADAGVVRFVEEIRLPPRLAELTQQATDTAAIAKYQKEKATQARARCARQLTAAGLSLRDAGHVLGVSYQRIQQLVRARQSP